MFNQFETCFFVGFKKFLLLFVNNVMHSINVMGMILYMDYFS
jgi:hypothetical protein